MSLIACKCVFAAWYWGCVSACSKLASTWRRSFFASSNLSAFSSSAYRILLHGAAFGNLGIGTMKKSECKSDSGKPAPMASCNDMTCSSSSAIAYHSSRFSRSGKACVGIASSSSSSSFFSYVSYRTASSTCFIDDAPLDCRETTSFEISASRSSCVDFFIAAAPIVVGFFVRFAVDFLFDVLGASRFAEALLSFVLPLPMSIIATSASVSS
mmetsp:Transcript_6884/g.23017  ORF Transcript_6884/g.23017 Transcript_6884/m.23017 type:complete len:212 (-) Transcript_6884:527-1162(-)